MRFFIIAFFLMLASCAEPKQEVTRDQILIDLAKAETLSRMKSPSTAMVIDSLTTVKSFTGDSTKFNVRISVDAENSFGAIARDRYIITYKSKGLDSLSSDNYELEMFQ